MARGVLVEQRVEEDRVQRADAAFAVDERDLAEARGALVAGGVARAAPRRSPRASIRTARPSRNSTSRPRTIEPPRTSGFVERTTPSVRGRVRRGEDLLRRQVGHVADARRRSRRPPTGTATSGSSPTVRSVPGPRKRSASNRRADQPLRRADERPPGARARPRSGRPRPGGRRAAICSHSRASAASGSSWGCTRPRPRPRRTRHRRPVRRALVDDLPGLLEERQLVAAGPRGVEVVQGRRVAGPGQADPRAALAPQLQQPLAAATRARSPGAPPASARCAHA